MILLLILTLSTFSLKAMTLAKYRSSPEGTSFQSFEVSRNQVTFEKRSNYFDKEKNFSIGKFQTLDKIEKKQRDKLAVMLSKIKDVNEFMNKKGGSFNDLTSKGPHETFILLDDFQISSKSDLYSELNNIFDSLKTKNWKQKSGIKLSQDFKTLTQVINGREVSQRSFEFSNYCKESVVPTSCDFKGIGILFVE